ncbi:restriction endonuclease subunit S [Streptococcus thermophilus]|uniref:restriction endonuclease subunit S n=1 Tax=Streptococcus thermophilus TaxID=1308 RepID=UPI0015C2A671|nr:restriction endonuclease subunit S [Streptococcus thermophilus]MCT2933864.1 restriction endonuclease subunit S [Streptococcus thermophilus]MCT2970505.1 restriction endonuclease subunit S [Streptococcus thermophilus]CAD0181817.1 Type I restriction-modification system, specificity subunit S [Streptococcus thermophilus]
MSSIRLGEIGKISMCKRILKSQTNEFSGIPFYKISTFGGTPTVYIDEKIYREYKEKYSYPKKGDILISAAGTIGKTVIFDGEDSYFQDSNIVWIENDESKVTNQFLYYFLQTNPFITTNGSTIKRLYNDNLRDTKIPNVPSIQQQNQITDILGTLDKKIQINNQINQELEAMAKTLYDYWFVQFDFPDQNGKPYKSSGGKMVYNPELKREIPEGWGAEKLSSLLKIGKETTNPKKFPNEEFKYYSIPEFDTTGTYSLERGESIKSNKFKVEKNDLLVSKLNPWFNRVIYNLEENAIASTEFIVWKTFNRFEKNFLYQVATGKEFIEYCTRFATGTSNSHKRVSPDIMVGFQIPFEKTHIQKFGEIIDSIRTQVLQNNEQNQELTQLRDWILPMLMNGQVKVE